MRLKSSILFATEKPRRPDSEIENLALAGGRHTFEFCEFVVDRKLQVEPPKIMYSEAFFSQTQPRPQATPP